MRSMKLQKGRFGVALAVALLASLGVQDDILGVTRAEMFRAKKITVDRFTDARGNVLTLDQLKKKDQSLFETIE